MAYPGGTPPVKKDEELNLLLPTDVEEPFFRSLTRNIKELIHPPKLPPLELPSHPVAVKEMRLGPDVGPRERDEYEQRILREARTAGRLSDPAVVTVFDVVHADGSIFIVMELVEAPTLAAVIREHGALPPATVADIGRQVLSALESAHAAGVVHRDVKPSNIMLSAAGRAKLTDFGIAQAADDPTLTQTGMVVGSPAYLAPEMASVLRINPFTSLISKVSIWLGCFCARKDRMSSYKLARWVLLSPMLLVKSMANSMYLNTSSSHTAVLPEVW